MAFARAVLINETILGYHEAVELTADIHGNRIYIQSWKDADDSRNPAKSPVTQAFDIPDTQKQAEQALLDAEQWAVGAGYYHEYVEPAQAALDEVLAILTDDQAEQVPDAFPTWATGKDYAVGYRVRYDGLLYKCLQTHTSQTGWEPPNATSLWARIGEGGIPEWVQPTSANPYMKGDKVRHIGKVWESLVDNNVWEPGSVGAESLWGEVQ